MYDQQFNPRYTFIYDCLGSEKGSANPNIWLCVSCHKCEEVCPYEVSPIKFIESLKSDAMANNQVPDIVRAEVSRIVTTGYSFMLTGVTERLRKELNLKPLTSCGIHDLTILMKKTGLIEKFEDDIQ